MHRLGRSVLLTGTLSAGLIGAGCQFIGGFAGNEIVDHGAGGQGGSVQGSGGSAGGEACMLRQAPSRPMAASTGEDVSFILATRAIELGEDLDVDIGLDIDDACSCVENDACACASVATCTRPEVLLNDGAWERCDEAKGVDANSKQLFATLKTLSPFLTSALASAAINSGGGSVLFDVREYNGQANDDDVFVGVYTTGAFQTADCNDGAPAWDGNDAWPIDRESLVFHLPACGESPTPTVFDLAAYVRDHQLIARFSKVKLLINLINGTIPFVISDASVVIPLEREDATGLWGTTGATLSGVWQVADVFSTLAALSQLPEFDICDNSMLNSMQESVCRFTDAATHTMSDRNCDAISFALAFNATEAKTGNSVTLTLPESCPELLAVDCETPIQ